MKFLFVIYKKSNGLFFEKMNEYRIKVGGGCILTIDLVRSLRLWFQNHGFESSRVIRIENMSVVLIKCMPEAADALSDGNIAWIKSVENTMTIPIFMQDWSSEDEP